MTDEEIIEMAKQAVTNGYASDKELIAFARLIAAKQRDLDAGICDRFAAREMHPYECAAAIRGQK